MMVKPRGRCDVMATVSVPMREALQAVTAMRPSVAANSGALAHFSDRVEKGIGSRR